MSRIKELRASLDKKLDSLEHQALALEAQLTQTKEQTLHRLEQQGWLKAQTGRTGTGREAKFYALTAAGRKQLAHELDSWDRLSTAIGLVVREAE